MVEQVIIQKAWSHGFSKVWPTLLDQSKVTLGQNFLYSTSTWPCFSGPCATGNFLPLLDTEVTTPQLPPPPQYTHTHTKQLNQGQSKVLWENVWTNGMCKAKSRLLICPRRTYPQEEYRQVVRLSGLPAPLTNGKNSRVLPFRGGGCLRPRFLP